MKASAISARYTAMPNSHSSSRGALYDAVQQRAEHVQVHDDEEERRAGGMQVADQPAPLHLAHDEFDRVERGGLARLVEHGEEDAGDELHHQHHAAPATPKKYQMLKFFGA